MNGSVLRFSANDTVLGACVGVQGLGGWEQYASEGAGASGAVAGAVHVAQKAARICFEGVREPCVVCGGREYSLAVGFTVRQMNCIKRITTEAAEARTVIPVSHWEMVTSGTRLHWQRRRQGGDGG